MRRPRPAPRPTRELDHQVTELLLDELETGRESRDVVRDGMQLRRERAWAQAWAQTHKNERGIE